MSTTPANYSATSHGHAAHGNGRPAAAAPVKTAPGKTAPPTTATPSALKAPGGVQKPAAVKTARRRTSFQLACAYMQKHLREAGKSGDSDTQRPANSPQLELAKVDGLMFRDIIDPSEMTGYAVRTQAVVREHVPLPVGVLEWMEPQEVVAMLTEAAVRQDKRAEDRPLVRAQMTAVVARAQLLRTQAGDIDALTFNQQNSSVTRARGSRGGAVARGRGGAAVPAAAGSGRQRKPSREPVGAEVVDLEAESEGSDEEEDDDDQENSKDREFIVDDSAAPGVPEEVEEGNDDDEEPEAVETDEESDDDAMTTGGVATQPLM